MSFRDQVKHAFFNYWDVDYDSDTVFVVQRDHYAASRHTFLYEISGKQLIATNPNDYPKLTSLARDRKTSIEELKESISDIQIKRIPDNGISFLNPTDLVKSETSDKYEIKHLDESYASQFKEFLGACSEEDIEQGQVSVEDEMPTGLVYKNKLVGVSSYWFWGESIADIGIIIHPEHRKKGLGKVLLYHQCLRGIEIHKINQYRYDIDNLASQELCKRAGFKELISLQVLQLKEK